MKKMNLFKKTAACLLTVMMSVLTLGEAAYAEELPYDTYNYNYREDIVMTPAPYVPDGSVTGLSLGTTNFKEPQDLCVAENGEIYIADTGNNRIVIMDADMKNVVRIIDSFERDGVTDTFSAPYGVCVSENNELYVADSRNKRVVVLTPEGEFIKIVDNPQSEILDDNFEFVPLKVTVDYADRIYVIGKNAFEGILVFESNGQFTGYFGTIEVKISLWEKVWRKLASKEERSNQKLYIPTEFTGIDVDSDGFIYASNIDSDGIQAVRRLNPQGKDVIQKGENANVGGDLVVGMYGDYSGPSEITDVVYRDKGMYSLLDKKRGRIFTYDKEGNLLYIFGGLGAQEGTFITPVAIEVTDEHIVVLDATHNAVMKFKETQYGALINDAVGLRFDGDETLAIAKWEEVLRLDENNELANNGIGKAYLTAGDNEKAMHYLEIGMNRKYYSIAWKRLRNEILADNLNYILTGAIILLIGLKIYKVIKRKKTGVQKEGGLL
ncbi:MAG: NHL repeat-containing protein [Lachnospiraceae bacterium]|nr:NHL repeat-containing protein [Lachnospiraceae bacterium]